MTDRSLTQQVAEMERDLEVWIQRAVHAERQISALREDVIAAERKATEAAREALTRFLNDRREGTVSDDQWNMLCDLERFRDREYPAPPSTVHT